MSRTGPIPSWLSRVVNVIRQMSPDERTRLRDLLGRRRDRSSIVAEISEAIDWLDSEAVADLLEGIVVSSMYGVDLDGFGADDAAERELFREVRSLIEAPAVRRLAYAAGLTLEHERRFRGARILTDVRPVFEPPGDEDNGRTVNLSPDVVLVSSLRLDYDTDFAEGSIWIGMTPNDLHELRDTADRAIRKLEALAGSLPWDATDLTEESQ